jgi:hypothetical protein
MMKVWHDHEQANFSNSLLMNIIAMVCTSGYFALLVFIRLF